MLSEIVSQYREVAAAPLPPLLDEEVLAALGSVPRHEFVPLERRESAYLNCALPIGHGQTISQPLVVALMTQALCLRPGDKVLELGSGSGYQAAVLSCLATEVYGVELVDDLCVQARERLRRLGYSNVELRSGDGHLGWPQKAPFDAITVGAAVDEVPQAILEQLKPGGRLILPLRGSRVGQDLTLIEKDHAGALRETFLLPVVFVPFKKPAGVAGPRS